MIKGFGISQTLFIFIKSAYSVHQNKVFCIKSVIIILFDAELIFFK